MPRQRTQPPHRTSVSELARLLAERRSTPTEQVSLRRNAKGDVQIEVEAVCAEDETLEQAALRCAEVYDQLVEWYPMSENVVKPSGDDKLARTAAAIARRQR